MSVTSPILNTLPPLLPPEPAAGVEDPELPPPQAAARSATAATAASAPSPRIRGRFTLPPEMGWSENGGHPTTTAARLPGPGRFVSSTTIRAMEQATSSTRQVEPFEPFEPRLTRIGAVDALALEARAGDLAKRSIKKGS